MSVERPIPDVYVLWHPACAIGQTIAARIYSWLRPGNGFGPDVFYRCLPAPDAPPGGLPLALPGEFRPGQTSASSLKQANMQVVILLIDEQMIADPVWRYWLAQLARATNSPVRRVFLPVALDSTAFNIPRPLSELNFLRPSDQRPDSQTAASAPPIEVVIRSLLKQLTEALCRLLLMPLDDAAANAAKVNANVNANINANINANVDANVDANVNANVNANAVPAPAAANTTVNAAANGAARASIGVPEGSQTKISLFLSHAKEDGALAARRLRDYIYSQTQLAAFYDENDIPFGSAFADVLNSSVQASQTAAMIAVKSARYASRPWCRRELALFRKPVQENPGDGKPERWRLNPMVVVNTLEPGKQTAGIPEIGNATHIGWSAEQVGQEEQIVTLVLRDVLLAAFHSALGGSIPAKPNQIIINWLPDPTTLLQIPRVGTSQEKVDILYPGRGLSGLELVNLEEIFPHVDFYSFDGAAS